MKIEEIRMNRQFQTYIDKLKPLLKAGGWCCGPIIDYFTTPDVKYEGIQQAYPNPITALKLFEYLHYNILDMWTE